MQKKNNRLDFVEMATGGHNQHVNSDKVETSIPNPKGLAKASPKFEEVEPEEELSEEEKEKAIAENTKDISE